MKDSSWEEWRSQTKELKVTVVLAKGIGHIRSDSFNPNRYSLIFRLEAKD